MVLLLFSCFSHHAGNPGHCFLLDRCRLGRYGAVGRGTRKRGTLPYPMHLVTDILASKQNDSDLISDAYKKLKPSFCGCPCKWWCGTRRIHMGISPFDPWGKIEVKDHSTLTLVCLIHKGVLLAKSRVCGSFLSGSSPTSLLCLPFPS